jgi:hypothetical protein
LCAAAAAAATSPITRSCGKAGRSMEAKFQRMTTQLPPTRLLSHRNHSFSRVPLKLSPRLAYCLLLFPLLPGPSGNGENKELASFCLRAAALCLPVCPLLWPSPVPPLDHPLCLAADAWSINATADAWSINAHSVRKASNLTVQHGHGVVPHSRVLIDPCPSLDEIPRALGKLCPRLTACQTVQLVGAEGMHTVLYMLSLILSCIFLLLF